MRLTDNNDILTDLGAALLILCISLDALALLVCALLILP